MQKLLVSDVPFYLKFWVKVTALERNRRFSISLQFNFILKTNRQTAVCITNRASMYVMQSVMMDKKRNVNSQQQQVLEITTTVR